MYLVHSRRDMSVTVPKRSQNAFFVFRSYINKKVQFPHWTHQNDISRYAGQLWRKMGTEEKSEFYRLAEEESLKETRVSGGRKCARTNKKKYMNSQDGQNHHDVHDFISATSSSYTEVSSISSSSGVDNYFTPSISSNISAPVHGISNLASYTRTLDWAIFDDTPLFIPQPVYAFPAWMTNNSRQNTCTVTEIPNRARGPFPSIRENV